MNYRRAGIAVISILAVFSLAPRIVRAELIWQSAPSHTDELKVYTLELSHRWFGTEDSPTLYVGTWDGPDFTTDASTTVHMWARWDGNTGGYYDANILDVGLDSSSGGNPYVFSGQAPTTTRVILSGEPHAEFTYQTVSSTTTLEEMTIPTHAGVTIHHGDELWTILIPHVGYANFSVGATGHTPQFQICEGECNSPPLPPACTENCYDNVLFLPGAQASRLYQRIHSVESRVWEPRFFQTTATALHMNPDGTSINSIYTKADAVMERVDLPVVGFDVYRTFIEQLDAMKNDGKITDYKVFPYDWRVSPEEVVNNGTMYDDGTHYLDQDLEDLAASSKTGKVMIVAHSNGGLVTKALMLKLQNEGKTSLVDKIIFAASPQLGTPKAVASMLHGDFQDIPPGLGGLMLSKSNARALAENMPDAYALLPSGAYFEKVADPVITLTDSPTLQSQAGISDPLIDDATDFSTFITGNNGGRSKPASSDTETPNVLSPALLAHAALVHRQLDNWTPPSGVEVFQIVGWGLDTPKGITYTEEPRIFCSGLSCASATTTLKRAKYQAT